MFVGANIRTLARSETVRWGRLAQLLSSVDISAWAWNIQLCKLWLQLEAHGEPWVLALGWGMVRLIGASAWSVQA